MGKVSAKTRVLVRGEQPHYAETPITPIIKTLFTTLTLFLVVQMPQVGVVPCTGRPLLKCPVGVVPCTGHYDSLSLRPNAPGRGGTLYWALCVLRPLVQMPQVGVVPCTGHSILVVLSKCPSGVVPCTGRNVSALSRPNALTGWYLVLGTLHVVVSSKCPRSGWYLVLDDDRALVQMWTIANIRSVLMPQVGVVPCTGCASR